MKTEVMNARVEPALKASAEKTLMDLVDKAIEGTTVSRFELLAALHDRYLELKRQRRKKEKVSISERLR